MLYIVESHFIIVFCAILKVTYIDQVFVYNKNMEIERIIC